MIATSARLLVRMFSPARSAEAARSAVVETHFRVMPWDLDVLLHMNNGCYLSTLDSGRMALYVRSGVWSRMRARKWHPVVSSQSIRYVRPLTLGTRYRVVTRLLGFDERDGYFEQTFADDESTFATAVVACRFLDSRGVSVASRDVLDLFDPDVRTRYVDGRVEGGPSQAITASIAAFGP